MGLAAPQVGVGLRVALISWGDLDDLWVNPVLVEASGAEQGEEGCLSIRGERHLVTRATTVVVDAAGLDGTRRTRRLDGFEARIAQHELDHLDGVLIADRSEGRRRR